MSEVVLQVWPRWLSKKLASIYTTYSIRQIDRFIRNGDLPHTRLNDGNVRIDIHDLDRLMEKNKRDFHKSRRKATQGIS